MLRARTGVRNGSNSGENELAKIKKVSQNVKRRRYTQKTKGWTTGELYSWHTHVPSDVYMPAHAVSGRTYGRLRLK